MRKVSRGLVRRVQMAVPGIDEHDIRAILWQMAASPAARVRRADADRALLLALHPVTKPACRFFKTDRAYRRWQNRQPEVGAWQWRVLMDRLAGRRSMPKASSKSSKPSTAAR